MIELINTILFNFFKNLGAFMPNLFGGLLILIVGFLIGGIVKQLIMTIVTFAKIDLSYFHTVSKDAPALLSFCFHLVFLLFLPAYLVIT